MIARRLASVGGFAASLVALLGCAPQGEGGAGTNGTNPPAANVAPATSEPEAVANAIEVKAPSGWTKSTQGSWSRWVSADKRAQLALAPLESAGKLAEKTHELAGVFGVSEVRLGSPQPLVIGSDQLKSQGSDGVARFASGDGVIACATVEAAGAKQVVVAYAFDKDATPESRQEAMAAVASLRSKR
jgi:hypothetical protein